LGNLATVVGAGLGQLGLLRYLVGQLGATTSNHVEALREFAPAAKDSDWSLITAGQRVQVMRPENRRGGRLEFDTSVVTAADGSIAGLLGASPGASVAVSAMLDVLHRCFPERYPMWLPTLTEMVPSLGVTLSREPAFYEELRSWTTKALELES
jgi:malate dehydrogenase (quinone)